jgi:hypothetical protein
MLDHGPAGALSRSFPLRPAADLAAIPVSASAGPRRAVPWEQEPYDAAAAIFSA